MSGDMWPDDPLSGGDESVPPAEDTWGDPDLGGEPDYLDAGYEEVEPPESLGPDADLPEPEEPEDLAAEASGPPADVDAVDESAETDHPDDEPATPAADAELPQATETSPFPASLDLDVHPSDGGDWVDPELLGWTGDDPDTAFVALDPPQDLLADLHEADRGDGEPSWSALTGSEDPAIRSLAALWAVPAT